MSLLTSVQQCAARAGLNLFGVVDASRFDRFQPLEQRCGRRWPTCGTIVVLGTGGRGFWYLNIPNGIARAQRARAELGAAAVSGATQQVAARLQAHSVPCCVVPGSSDTLNFQCLGEAAGFGTVSPVSNMLLHPQFGPWVRVRAALLLDGYPFGPIADASITDRFHPCCTCAKPCVTACPSRVHDGQGSTDHTRCASARYDGGCGEGCGSRRACPIGREHSDPVDALLHAHSSSLRSVQRCFGLGLWRMVPRLLRRRSNGS